MSQTKRKWCRVPSDTSKLSETHPSKTLIVFDFDCTLSAIHLYHTLRKQEGRQEFQANKEEFLLRVFGGPERLASLQKFISHLHSLNVPMLVLSFGVEEEIKPALEFASLLGYFDEIYDAFSYSKFGITSSSGAKADMLAEFTKKYADRCNRVLFVDDDRGNFPARGLLGSEPFDEYYLESAVGSPDIARMHVYPVGDQKDGDGLAETDFACLTDFVLLGSS